MGQHIDQFCETLRLKLTDAEGNLSALRTKIDVEAENAARDVQSHLDAVKKRIEQGEVKASAARADVDMWLEQRKATASGAVAEWKSKREIAKLQTRADRAKRYLAATIDIAEAAIDEAEVAALEAWLARRDAESAMGK